MIVDRESRLLEALDRSALFVFDYDKMNFITGEERKVVNFLVDIQLQGKLPMSSDLAGQRVTNKRDLYVHINSLIEKDVVEKLPFFGIVKTFSQLSRNYPVLPKILDQATSYRLDSYRGSNSKSLNWRSRLESAAKNTPQVYIAKVATKVGDKYVPSYGAMFSF